MVINNRQIRAVTTFGVLGVTTTKMNKDKQKQNPHLTLFVTSEVNNK